MHSVPPTIRLATEADIAPLLAISNWAAVNTPANFAIEPEPLDDWLESWRATHERHPWLVAVEDEASCDGSVADDPRPGGPQTPGPPSIRPPSAIIGFAKASPHRGRCAYAYTAETSVYVHPEHHGRGVGRALYERLLPILKAQGYVTILAGITLPNSASQRLHESFGFRRIGVFQRVGWKFDQWHDVSYWQLDLQSDGPPMPPPTRILSVDEAIRQCGAETAEPR